MFGKKEKKSVYFAEYDKYMREKHGNNYDKGGKSNGGHRSIFLMLSWIGGIVYFCFLMYHFFGELVASSTLDVASFTGVAIASALAMPHMLFVFLGFLFTLVGWAAKKRSFALTGAIMYSVSMMLFPVYAMFVAAQMAFAFIGFSLMVIGVNSVPHHGAITAVVVVLLIGVAVYFGYRQISGESLPAVLSQSSSASSDSPEAEQLVEATTEPIELSAGDWVCGADFPAGRYCITADELVNVSSSDSERYLNALIEKDDGGYTTLFKDGETVHCSGKITLTPVKH